MDAPRAHVPGEHAGFERFAVAVYAAFAVRQHAAGRASSAVSVCTFVLLKQVN